MANSEYHKMFNFSRNGELGISNAVIFEIVTHAVNDCEGAEVAESQSRLFSKGPVVCKYSKNDELILEVSVKVKYGYNIADTSMKVQEKIEHDLLYMTEIRPKKIHLTIADLK